jgi:type 1 glutamine amidotransferase
MIAYHPSQSAIAYHPSQSAIAYQLKIKQGDRPINQIIQDEPMLTAEFCCFLYIGATRY